MVASSGLIGLAAAVVLLILFFSVAWIVGDEREAVGQPAPTITTPSSASPSPTSASPSASTDDLGDFSDLLPGASAGASASARADAPANELTGNYIFNSDVGAGRAQGWGPPSGGSLPAASRPRRH